MGWEGHWMGLWRHDYSRFVMVTRMCAYRRMGMERDGSFVLTWIILSFPGLLPYYFLSLSDPELSLQLDHCKYNTMFDQPQCKNASLFPSVRSVHFTVCQKPWSCINTHKEACEYFKSKWFELRDEVSRRILTRNLVSACDTCSCFSLAK